MYRLARTLLTAFTLAAVITPLALAENLPTSWVDKDTGHRVFRLTNEPGSSGFYFNVNAYTPDGKEMVYNAPDGIHVFDLATRKSKLLVPNPPRPANADGASAFRSAGHAIVVGKKTPIGGVSKCDASTNTS